MLLFLLQGATICWAQVASLELEGNRASTIYETDFIPTVTGQWTAQAMFLGDDRHAPAQSAEVSFTVLSKGGAGGPDDCARLCPRDYFILIIILVIVLALMLFLYRRVK